MNYLKLVKPIANFVCAIAFTNFKDKVGRKTQGLRQIFYALQIFCFCF